MKLLLGIAVMLFLVAAAPPVVSEFTRLCPATSGWGCKPVRLEEIAAPEGSVAGPNQQQDLEHADTKFLLDYPRLISRRGSVLTVQGLTFRDDGDCQSGDCARYRVDAVWKDKHVGVEATYYEERDYFLVTGGEPEPIGSRPISSPSGTRFFTGHHSDHRWSPYQGASVWEWEPWPRRLRIVESNLIIFDNFVGWRGDGCVEFTGARGYTEDADDVRTFWLAEQNGDWQLLENRPATCH